MRGLPSSPQSPVWTPHPSDPLEGASAASIPLSFGVMCALEASECALCQRTQPFNSKLGLNVSDDPSASVDVTGRAPHWNDEWLSAVG